jgi:predicted house-cleaning noncanonical NTP pyrophosphatase (MazG superfamily)
MPKFKFGKLVRDRIVEHQLASGAKPVYRQLDAEEHKRELVQKIVEEATEITGAAVGDIAAEIADVQQALDDLREKYGFTVHEIQTIQASKNIKNGAFKKGLFVEYIELAEDDKWTKYYRQEPDRYPEIK